MKRVKMLSRARDAPESVSEYIKELDRLIDKLWKESPDEINVFNEPSYIPGWTRYVRIIRAVRLLEGWYSFFSYMKTFLKKGVSLEIIKSITEERLPYRITFIEALELNTTSQLLKKFLEVLPDIQNKDEYFDIADRLQVYCRRLGNAGWIDTLFVHDAEMSQAYDLLFPPKI